MKFKGYTIRDVKAEMFGLPFFKTSHGEAERNFDQAVNDEKSTLNKYPNDFSLYYVGDYDDSTATMIPLEIPQHLIDASQLIKKL